MRIPAELQFSPYAVRSRAVSALEIQIITGIVCQATGAKIMNI